MLGTLKSQGLGDQLAEDDVHVGDQAEGDGNGDGVGVDGSVRHAVDELHASTSRATMGSPIQPRVRLAIVMPS